MVMFATVVAVLGLLYVFYLSAKVLAKEAGNATMQELSGYIYEGAMAFLRREYQAIALFAILVTVLLAFGISWQTALAYLIGAVCSLGTGLMGMHIATRANVRTAQAANKGFNEAISVAFPGGAVMGMSVVSIGLCALSVLYWLFGGGVQPGEPLLRAVNILAGFSMGASSVAFFAGDTMRAVGRAAFGVVEEVRRQFREIPGLMEGTARAEYARCADITTAGALREMAAPGVMAVAIPIVVGIVFGVEALGGMLAGALVSGVPLALHLANAGGAWDNAKKYIEAGNIGGKGSEAHKAAVVGDTVGGPVQRHGSSSDEYPLKIYDRCFACFCPPYHCRP